MVAGMVQGWLRSSLPGSQRGQAGAALHEFFSSLSGLLTPPLRQTMWPLSRATHSSRRIEAHLGDSHFKELF